MSKLLMSLLAAGGIALAGSSVAAGGAMTHDVMSKDAYNAQKTEIKTQYKADEAACKSMSGNAKDVCKEEAKGKRNIATADAEASYKGTPSARYDAKVARVESQYKVAKEKCDDLNGNAKDVCVKEAKAAEVDGKSKAKAENVAATSSQEASQKTRTARRDATEDSRDAEYKVALARCDSMAGDAKVQCVNAAKSRFGHS